jgi:hypothetical protein
MKIYFTKQHLLPGIAWFAWYCLVLPGIAWYCLVFVIIFPEHGVSNFFRNFCFPYLPNYMV